MTQTSQALAIFLLTILGTVPGILLMPEHYQIYIAIIAAGPLLVLLPLVAFILPESPRWLEAHGRHHEAEQAVTTLERLTQARYGALPSPTIVTVAEHPPKVGIRDLFGPEYGRRTGLLFVCWVLGYSGLIYGPLGFLNLYLAREGFSAKSVFLAGLTAGLAGGAAGLLVAGRTNERFERKAVILAGAILASVGLCLVFVAAEIWHSLVALAAAEVLMNAGIYLWLFNMYTYTAVAYPTRIRAVGTGWTDGFGHLGSMASPLIVGSLFTATANLGYVGFFAYVIVPGALLPALLLARFGIDQKAAPLEAVAG